jgi:membrane protein
MPADTVNPPRSFHWDYATIKRILVDAWNGWNKDNAPRLGAALAYYTVLSLAPLLLVVITIAGFVFGREAVQGQIMYQISGMVGTEGGQAIETMLKNAASQKTTGVWASILGVLTLLFGASAVVGELRSSLNNIWRVKEDEGITALVKQKSYAFGVVIGAGFLLLVSLVLSAGLQAAGKFVGSMLPVPAAVLEGLNIVISLVVITGVFAFIFKFLPDVDLKWSDVWMGAAFTAILFTIGKTLIGLYLGKAGFGSTFGAAGSLVVVLVWVYYSAQIFFFGAEFTKHYACLHGSTQPKPDPKKLNAEAPHWMAYGSPAVSGNTGLPPVMPMQPPVQHGFLASVGALLGIGLAAGKITKVLRSEVKQHDGKQ